LIRCLDIEAAGDFGTPSKSLPDITSQYDPTPYPAYSAPQAPVAPVNQHMVPNK